MRFALRALAVAVLVAAAASGALCAQEPAPAPTPQPVDAAAPAPAPTPPPGPGNAPAPDAASAPSSAPVSAPASAPAVATAPLNAPAPGAAAAPATAPPPAAAPSARILDPASVSVARLPADNPYGSSPDSPAALPAKLVIPDGTISTGMFLSVHVDATGRPLSVRRDRDPIPSLAAETMKSIQRWTINPARRAGQPVDTWGAFRLELSVEIDSPKQVLTALTPVTPSAPLSAPFAWPPETEWLETRHPPVPTDGSVSILEVDTAPIPQKSPWSADRYKGPFSAKYWIHIDKTGRIDRAIPLQVTDPVFLPYFRRAMSAWACKPALLKGVPVDSWNELTISGQISFDDEIKQIAALRRAVGP